MSATVEEKEARSFTVKGREGLSLLLLTEVGEVEVSDEMFREARPGDSLLIQRDPYRIGAHDLNRHVSLLRSGHVIHQERPSDFFAGALLLFVLLPLLSFRPYESWKDDIRLKVLFVLVPPGALFIILFSL